MRSRNGRRAAGLLAVAVLSALSLSVVQDAFFHTDDGCAVERHCLACRWHHGAAAVSAAVTAPLSAPEPGDVLAHAGRIVRLETARPDTPSRAPPLA
jgi:hypothetical protein